MGKIFVDEEGNDCELLTLEELRPKHEGNRNVLLQTIVSGSSEIEHYPYSIVYKCLNCHIEPQIDTEDVPDWRDLPMKYRCDKCNIEMKQIQVSKGQLRKILMTEQGTKNPIHLIGYLYGEDINKIEPGTKLNIRGTLKSRKNNSKDLTYKRFFDIMKFSKTEDKIVPPTDEEIQEFKDMNKTLLIKSFAPHIRNMYLIKEALLLACIGGVERDGVRGDINVLLLGDPGLAKTQLLKFVTKIVRKSDYISGKSASGAGLFGGVDNLSDNTRIGKPGSVTLCNGGVAALDEMEKMNPADRVYCHEVMESQTFSLRKIGIDITWEVKVAIIGAANPKKSVWNPQLTINENVNLPASLLSRFGLIFLIRDIPNRDEDLAIAEHIARVRRGDIEKPLEPETITKFITYAKTLKPVEDEECGNVLTEWWSTLRQENQREGSIAVDIRTLEDLHRLAEAYARLHLSETVTTEHAKMAIKMLKESLHTLGMNTPGEKNASITESMNKNDYIAYVFKQSLTHDQAIAKLTEKYKWFPSEEKAHEQIVKLKNAGMITESGGKYTWVN
jgi:replicative DNA helicase Mcm